MFELEDLDAALARFEDVDSISARGTTSSVASRAAGRHTLCGAMVAAVATVTLPYQFDTMTLPRNILKGLIALVALMVVLALAMLVKHGVLAAIPFPLAAAFLVRVGRNYLTVLDGSAKGTLTRDAVVVEPSALGPVRLPSPVGRHPLDRFKAVRVTYRGPNRNSGGYLYARIELVGREGTPNVCVAFERDVTAKGIAPELAAAVALPLEQVGLAPF